MTRGLKWENIVTQRIRSIQGFLDSTLEYFKYSITYSRYMNQKNK